MEKIKVLMIGNHPSVKGGITSVIQQLLEHDWNEEGIDMSFIPSYKSSNKYLRLIYFSFAYLRIVKKFLFDKPDVVHIHMSYRGSFARKYSIHKLCRKFNIPDIIHLHGSEFEKWFNSCDEKKQRQIKTLLSESSRFIVLGNEWNNVIEKIEPSTNTVVVSNTVHIPIETVKWNSESFTFLFLGVLIPRKGVMDLLDAFSKIKEKYSDKNIKLIITGTGSQEEEIKQKCHQLLLEESVEFAGWITGDTKKKLILQSQALVLPSYNEGLPIAILEAMSYGMPIISTTVGDIASAVLEGQNGYLLNPGDILSLTEGMEKVMAGEEDFTKLSHASKQLAREKFSDEKYYAQMSDCYRNSIMKK